MELLSTFILLGRVTAVQVGRWPEKGPHLRCSLQGAQPGERGGVAVPPSQKGVWCRTWRGRSCRSGSYRSLLSSTVMELGGPYAPSCPPPPP